MADELARLDIELGEVDLLVTQAKTEAARHETRRAAGAEKVTRGRWPRIHPVRAPTRPSPPISTRSSSC